jgi:type I restriction enzyme S subunit
VISNKTIPEFTYYLTKSTRFTNLGSSELYGVAGQKRVPESFLSNYVTGIPPLPEQQKIAQFLDQETGKIDKLITKKERLIELLKEKRTALISHAVTKGLNPDVPMKDSGVEWLGAIPEHWEVKKLKYIFQVFNGSTPKSGVPEYWDGNIFWVTPDDLGKLKGSTIFSTERKITQSGYLSCGTKLVAVGSLVLSTRAPIGHLAITGVELCTNQGCRCLVFRYKDSIQFFYYFLMSARRELELWGQGTTFQELAKGKLESVFSILPPLPEQQKIAQFLDRETSKIDNLITKTRTSIDHLKEYRTALISAAVTGKIDVREH